jgi:ABC-type Fe3+ transport system permease subunit
MHSAETPEARANRVITETSESVAAHSLPSRLTGREGLAGETLALLSLVPIVAALAASFSAPSGSNPYVLIWGTAKGWAALRNTLALSALAATAAVALAGAVAHWTVRLSRASAVLAALLCCLPVLLPSSLLAAAWTAALGRQGVLRLWLEPFTGPWGWSLFSLSGAAGVLALRYFGVAAIVLTWHGLRRRSTWAAEAVLCPAPAPRAIQLHLRPLLRPAAAAWLLVTLLCMNDHVIPDLLLVSTYGTQVLILYSAMLDLPGAAALAAPMGAVGAAMIAAALVLIAPERSSSDGQADPPRRAGPKARAVLGIAAALSAALAFPAAVLAWRAGSLAALGKMLGEADAECWQTLRLSASAGAICAVLGAVITAGWLARRRRAARSLGALALLNLTVPPSLLAIGVIALTNYWPLSLVRDTSWPLVLGYVARFLPVAVLVLYLAWRDESQLPAQAAAVHGVSRMRTVLFVLWPARRLAMATAALLCMLLAATELEVSTLLAPPGGATLGVRLATLMHTAGDSLVSALALDILLLAGPLIAAVVFLVLLVSVRKGGDR